ncbi:MAG: DoxX family protein [Methylotenera sp. 24-45-7]|jgi:putative oxidoreductase|nr:MAG: DoxX family protein [Mehylophilales bacterium 35-46-6]OYY84356.1 MAG: DoxX family protein [Methylophilales bacterium 16-45-9]OYZ41141.1 MAG: DoxX family protein [Methylotenera sp. 24-45-7]OZA08974.1 MAG: DoxX family protein [Methylotenera sp. 17-45-7]OZA53522.1 MAG: DoxX family protein [Methylophilales bacterium 39-45-7]HQS36944.1 DoxX family protein [Methylotenera sp.]
MCPKLFDVPVKYYQQTTHQLNNLANYLPPLFLRLILAVEFGSAGLEKFHGSNWFTELSFPFPFNLLPAEISWGMATYFEIFGAIALVLGLATRFFSASLFILTIVAIASVHWASDINSLSDLLAGYRIIDEEGDGLGNYKLPLIYMVMFLPLIFGGAGKLSVDYLLKQKCCLLKACKLA